MLNNSLEASLVIIVGFWGHHELRPSAGSMLNHTRLMCTCVRWAVFVQLILVFQPSQQWSCLITNPYTF